MSDEDVTKTKQQDLIGSALCDNDTAGREMNRSEDDEERPSPQGEASSSASTLAEHTTQHPGGMTDLDLLPNGIPKEVANEISGYGSDCDLQTLWPEEMFVPGLVIHMVKEAAPVNNQSWWQSLYRFVVTGDEKQARHHAVLKDRKNFRDFVISPDMFMDHSPWRYVTRS